MYIPSLSQKVSDRDRNVKVKYVRLRYEVINVYIERYRPTILVKILTVMIRAHDGRAECCLNWNIYDIGVNCEF